MLPRNRKTLAAAAVAALVVVLTAQTNGPAVASEQPVTAAGHVTATFTGEVDATANAAGPQLASHGRTFATLRGDGRPSAPTPAPAGAPATRGAQVGGPLATAPNTVRLNIQGVDNNNAHCACQPPDVNAAVSASYIAEAVNLEYRVFTKTGTQKLTTGLNTFFNTAASLSDPRVLFDNAWQRWVIVMIPVPASTSSTPQMLLAVSKTNNPTGAFYKYTLSFGGGGFPAGTLLDYPQIGMDSDGLVVSSNNFQLQPNNSFTYLGTTVEAFPKQRTYNGLGFGAGAFGVNLNTSPAVVAGIPMDQANALYLLSPKANGNGGSGSFLLYRMENTGRTSPTLVQQADVPIAWAPPTRAANQPGHPASLDTLDGRFDWAPMQNGSHLWFAHTANLANFPTVQYGFVDTGANTATSAFAFHSGTSDDWNPSIGVSPSGGQENVFLNWATADSSNPVSATYGGLRPGEAVTGISTSPLLITGSPTTQTRFGDYSSVSIDPKSFPGCTGAGRNAVIAQQYFAADGTWLTRIAEVGHC